MVKKDKTISVEILKENGYRENPSVSSLLGENFFQKKIDDEKGIKYFIDCNNFYLNTISLFEFKIQIETPKGAVNIQTVEWFNNDGLDLQNTIKDVEEYFEKMWLANGCPYYKLYGNN